MTMGHQKLKVMTQRGEVPQCRSKSYASSRDSKVIMYTDLEKDEGELID